MLPLLVVLAFEGPPLQVPWQCGVVKSCTQGHNGFSHSGVNQWAWDFGIGEGEEVLAASAGTVSHIRMSQIEGGCDPSYITGANYVVVDHHDGTSITYVHLQGNSSPLEVGDEVVPGMLVGRVGLTGYVCGAHLHLEVFGTCGESYCPSVPATFEDYGDPAQGDSIVSTNCPECTLVLDGTQTLVSELDPGCFVRETTAWWSAFSGDDDHHFYTFATDAAAAESTGTWRFGVSVPGDYRVEVFVPDADANATGAVYEVRHDGGVAMIALDQATAKGWQELGVFGFSGSEGESVLLGDNTGESQDLAVRIGYDAVRLTFVASAGDTSGTDASDDTTNASSESSTSESSTTASTSDGGLDPESTGVDDGALSTTFGSDTDDTGCACATSGDPASWTWLAWLLLPLRRRARRRSA